MKRHSGTGGRSHNLTLSADVLLSDFGSLQQKTNDILPNLDVMPICHTRR